MFVMVLVIFMERLSVQQPETIRSGRALRTTARRQVATAAVPYGLPLPPAAATQGGST
jgi:hypothetical protein